ncbi:MAG: hypothetical protein CMP98_07835 [Gammaproteobacteria bacterium]|nr:hypothetical protein [Gammaproteobacteria bacterium]OUU09383.1 MAG: hypothetical protein CBB94_07995 [Gammaproteobacteria bacterium TMED34]|tara:strand:- start:65 stop:550 length:486 start_codon:yes stop_codon:yes gene_type:complete
MSLPREIALSPDQLEDMMLTTWNIRIATHGPGEHINLTPMWFGWAGGKVYMTARGQKVVNVRQNSNCTLLLDHNEKFPELMGIMMRATAKVLENKATEDADPHLAEARVQMGVKYNGGHGAPPTDPPVPNNSTAKGSNRRWIVITPRKTVTWDNHKLDRIR